VSGVAKGKEEGKRRKASAFFPSLLPSGYCFFFSSLQPLSPFLSKSVMPRLG